MFGRVGQTFVCVCLRLIKKGAVLIQGGWVKEEENARGKNQDYDDLWDAQRAHPALPGDGKA